MLSMLIMFMTECERLPTSGGTPWDWATRLKTLPRRAGGKGKEAAGVATGDESLRAEGQADQVKGDLKRAGKKVKNAFKKD